MNILLDFTLLKMPALIGALRWEVYNIWLWVYTTENHFSLLWDFGEGRQMMTDTGRQLFVNLAGLIALGPRP